MRGKTTEGGTDLNVAIHGLYTVHGQLSVNDDERYAVDAARSSGLGHLFYAI